MCTTLWTGIIIPLASAIIGGGLTLLGVLITIQHENRCRKEDHERELKIHAKPILINYGLDRPDISEAVTFNFSESGAIERGYPLTGVLKNTDNGIAFVDKIVSGNVTYIPIHNCTINKNTVAKITVFLADKKEEFKGATMFVHDIYGNAYCYDLKYNTAQYKNTEFILGSIDEPEGNVRRRGYASKRHHRKTT